MAKIIVIEDEQSLQQILEYDLQQQDHEVDLADDGIKGLDMLKNKDYDLAIIDWMLPNLSGIEIIESIRELNKKVKIILLTARADEMDIVKGLEAGANDYVTKPFSPRELSARIKALLRDSASSDSENTDSVVQVTSRISIDYPRREVYLDGELAKLTKLEYNLFVYLVDNKNKVVSREEIFKHIWEFEDPKKEKDNRVIDVYIHSIKKHLDITDEIESKRGVGYIFDVKNAKK